MVSFINFYNVFLFIIVVIIAMILGLTIINVVDKRLSEISINIPKQNIVVNVPEKNNTIEGFDSGSESKSSHTLYKTPQKGDEPNETKNQIPFTNNGSEVVCSKDHNHGERMGLICTYGPTNYQNPADMNERDRMIFKTSYPSNMTLQDYINWLWLYKNQTSGLTVDHRKNLEALKKGIQIKYSDKPTTKESPPLTAENYFDKMYSVAGSINWSTPLNMDTQGLIGYNYGEYSEFGDNFNQMGTSVAINNPGDLPIKESARTVDMMVRHPISTTVLDNKQRERMMRD